MDESSRSDLAPPIDAGEVSFLVILDLEIAFVCLVQRLGYVVRQMNIGCLDDQEIRMLLDAHDAMKWMRLLFPGLAIARDLQQLISMLRDVAAAQRDDACRIIIAGAMAGLARGLVSILRWWRDPLPAAFVKDRAAIRADSRLRELVRGLVGIMDMLVHQPVASGAEVGFRSIVHRAGCRLAITLMRWR